MKLSIKALAISSGVLWALAILMVAGANLFVPGYGIAFLELAGSIYPGYAPGNGISSVIIGTLYGLIDASIAGAIFAWLYNQFSG